MPRLISVLVALLALNLSVFVPHVRAATIPSVKTVRVMVGLAGEPLAADPYLKARTKATRYRFRLDVTLPTARMYGQALDRYQDREIAYIRSHGIHLDIHWRFHTLFNGFSATVPTDQVARLQRLANVRLVRPVRKYVPLLDRSLELINAPKAWPALGGAAQAGKGIFIANLDTGIDIGNPCFRPAGLAPPPFGIRADTVQNRALTNNKVIVARAFGSNQNAHFSAADAVGHGTFTGSIEACDANTITPLGTAVSGVAPDAYLGNYNVFPDAGDEQGLQDPIIAALEAALQDGADVANLSLGSVFGAGDPSLDPEIPFVNLASKAGMVIVVAAGNAGPTAQSVSSPATAPDAIAVGAVTNSRGISSSLIVSGPNIPADLVHSRANEGSSPFTGKIGPAPMVYVGLGRLPNDDTDNPTANDFAGKDLHGKIALIQRGTIFFETKIKNAAAAGAIGAIVFDNRFELNLFTMDVKSATLPAMSINQNDGNALLAYVQSHPDATATLDSTKMAIDETPDVLSDFSARGYGPDYSIKPDLVAPGQDIYAATENKTPNPEMYDPTGFTTQQGTSFSAPHVAGAVALLQQKHSGQKWTTGTYKAVLMETAARAIVTEPNSPVPTVMEVGSGMMDVQAAVSANAGLLPASASLGQINVSSGEQQRSIKLTLNDLGGGSGNWLGSVETLHGSPGVTLKAPASISVAAGSHADISVPVTVAATTANGDYDGYLVFQRGTETLHVPYFLHVANAAVKAGSVLLVDDTTSRYQPDAPTPRIERTDVSRYYEQALTDIGKQYTYWDEGQLGAPSVADMKQASAVIYFTGANLNAYAHENANYQALMGPLNTIDVANLHRYLDGGGRVFVSGMAAALSDLTWVQLVLGAGVAGFSVYDNKQNDKDGKGGISPPQPSAVVDTRSDNPENPYLFADLKGLDFSTKGDGAGDNVAVANAAVSHIFGDTVQTIGVTSLAPYTAPAQDNFYPAAYGKAVLRTTDTAHADGRSDVAVVSSNDPTLSQKSTKYYLGRSVLFSFGFEGINDNTGYATRAQVLKRLFDWLDDKPVASVTSAGYVSRHIAPLKASLHVSTGVRAVEYQWQVGKTTLKASKKPTQYRFSHAGTFKIRVQITDSLGHTTVSPWKNVKVT